MQNDNARKNSATRKNNTGSSTGSSGSSDSSNSSGSSSDSSCSACPASTACPRVAVTGAGHWGKNLIRNFYRIGSLQTICDSSPDLQKEFAAKYPQVNIESSFSQVLNDPEVQGVVLATPAGTHFTLARKSMEHGKDVFVEKPLCLNPDEGRQLCKLAEKKKRILMVGHLLHYHPAVRKIKEMVFSGKLGKIHHIYSNRLNLGIFRQEENVMWSFAPHDISIILSLTQSLPAKLSATGTATLNPKLPDTVHLKMAFANGLYGNVFVSWLHPFKEQRLVVTGDNGMLVFSDAQKENKLLYYSEPVSWDGTKPIPNRQEPEATIIGADEPLNEECLAFVRAIETRKQPPTDGEEGLRVLKILSAAQSSLDNNGAWVEMKTAPAAGVDENAMNS